eukprot:m.79016 g.79016  ORF g.79016 m.79016 type:complete len:612 (+) comp25171_c0_seq3:189-2024(+)
MNNHRGSSVFFAVLGLVNVHCGFACTTIIAGKNATTTGATLASHTDDAGYGADARLLLVAAQDWAPGAQRPIFYDLEDYPHEPQAGQKPIGYIPQVAHTYAHYSCTFGIMNEMQVGMGETTCSGVFGAEAVGHGGKALLSIDSLSRIALERCPTSRCAVQTMGDLAVKYGFYGAGSFEGSSESLMVIDPNEAFIFHVLPDPTATSAIWVAQRVPDDGVGVVANMFTVRGVNLTDSHNFLGSDNMHTIAEDVLHAWNASQGLLDFTRVFSDGEYAHKYYSGRRMWGVYHLLAPSLQISDSYTDLKFDQVYPTTFTPDFKVGREDLFRVHRSYYEGTKYDMTTGVAAGPWGNPDRWNSGTGKVKGSWERSISLFRTSHIHVVEARAWLPNAIGGLLWYGSHTATGTSMVPFAAGMQSIPHAFGIGDPNKLDHESAYWTFRIVFNMMHIKYNYMREDVNQTQIETESASGKLVEKIDKAYMATSTTANNTSANITAMYIQNAENVLSTFQALPDMLLEKYADGWLNDASSIPYSDTWLNLTDFSHGPGPVPCPPCPCTPTTSPQCTKCCKGNISTQVEHTPPPTKKCNLRDCIAQCSDLTTAYRECVSSCTTHC